MAIDVNKVPEEFPKMLYRNGETRVVTKDEAPDALADGWSDKAPPPGRPRGSALDAGSASQPGPAAPAQADPEHAKRIDELEKAVAQHATLLDEIYEKLAAVDGASVGGKKK